MVSRSTPALERPAAAGMSLAEVDTPSLLLDLDAFESNLAAMSSAVRDRGVRLRPHAKAHKCAEIARRQLAAGAVGVCCQKVSEAEAMVAAGVGNVLISNEVVGRPKLERLAALAKRAEVAVCVDHPANAADLDRAARAAGVRLEVLVEIDVGAKRCGIAPGQPALELARTVATLDHLRFAGLQAYHGAAQHVRSIAERRAAIERSIEVTRSARQLLEDHGLECRLVTGGGTGSFLFELEGGVYDEVQPGSYRASDEHGVLTCTDRVPRLGDKLRLVPGHCDPTVNLHDWLVCVRGDTVEAIWPVSARGAMF
jgi:D-serine deaminase-like pyridoxal phosphate-dependent protein